VAGGMDDSDATVADFDDFAIGQRFILESNVGSGAERQPGADSLGEIAGAGGMIGVNMSVDDVGDAQAMLLGDRLVP